MLKYKYLYKEYIIRVFVLTIVLLFIMFFQFGFKDDGNTLKNEYRLMVYSEFTSIQFLIPMFLFDNFKKSKMELIRTKNIFISQLETLFLTIIMALTIRVLSCSLYCIIVCHNFKEFDVIFRLFFCDICMVLISYTLFNIFKNRYVGLIISLVICVALYIPKWLCFDLFNTDVFDKFIKVGYMPFVGLGIFLVLYFISIIWRKEYVRD